MSGCESRFPKLVDRAFVRGLSARQREGLREHLKTCDSCRQRWDRLATIDRQMGGPRLSGAMIEDVGERLHVTLRPHRARWWAAGGLAAALAAAALLFTIRSGDPVSEFSPRGNPSLGRTPGVRMFCVAGDADHVRAEVRMVSSGTPPALRCTIADDLQFAYSTPDREGLTMVAFARLDSTMIHYAPTSMAGPALAVRADRVDELLAWSSQLSAEHRVGNYDVFVRFFDREVSALDAVAGRTRPVVELRARLEITGGDSDAR